MGSVVDALAGDYLILHSYGKNSTQTKTSSRVLDTPLDKKGNTFFVPSSTKAGSATAISIGGKIARHSRGVGVLLHS